MTTEKKIIITHPYKGIVLKFDEVRHRFWANEVGVPSVTHFTGVVDKSRPLMIWQERLTREGLLERWRKSGGVLTEKDILECVAIHRVKKEQAATSGTAAHAWAEDFAKGLNPEMPTDEKVANAVMAFLKWIDEEKFKITMPEKHLYSKKYKFAGIADAIAKRKGKLALIDYKTSSGVYDEMYFQTAAYQQMLIEMGIKIVERWIVRFDKETGEFHPTLCPDFVGDFRGFLGCRQVVLQQEKMKKI